MQSLFRILLIAFLLPTLEVAAQTYIPEGSYVELSPAEIQSLVRKLARYQRQIAEATPVVPAVAATTPSPRSADVAELREQLRRIEGMLLRLSERRDSNAAYRAPARNTPSLEESGQTELLNELRRQRSGIDELEDRLATAPTSTDPTTINLLRAELEGMRRQLAEMEDRAVPVASPTAPRLLDTTVQVVIQEVAIPANNPVLDALNEEVIALRKTIADNRRIDSIRLANIASPTFPAPAAAPKAIRTSVNRDWPAIHFANGSDIIPDTDLSILQAVIRTCRENPMTRLVVVGFASPKGNPGFNTQLAARRAEAVSRSLQQAGVNPENIDTVYGGIDYQTTDPAAARRVEIRTTIFP